MNFGLYIHIPFCKRKCSYCSFISMPKDDDFKRMYVDRVIDEGRSRLNNPFYGYGPDASGYSDRNELHTLYIGGGTPSALPQGELTRLIREIGIEVSELEEFTVELNPNSLTDELIEEYLSLGVTRFSVGVQSLNDKSLRALGRLHDAETALGALSRLRKIGRRVSADYMLGIPYQRPQDIAAELKAIVASGAEHVSCYGLMIEEGTPIASAATQGRIDIPDDDMAADCYDSALLTLESLGLPRYETSNFGVPCLHNLGYWRLRDYIGLGVSAHSCIRNTEYIPPSIPGDISLNSDNTRQKCHTVFKKSTFETRIANTDDLDKYMRGDVSADALFNDIDDAAAEFIMLGLRLDQGIELSEFGRLFGDEKLNSLSLRAAAQANYLNISSESIAVKREYAYVANFIIAELI